MSVIPENLNSLLQGLKQLHPELAEKTGFVSDHELLSDASSAAPGLSSLVAYPGSTAEVCALINLARECSVPVTPRGSATGLSGGSVPLNHGLIIDLKNMNRVLEFDPEARRLVCEPGVTLGEIEDLLDEHGFMYPPDPASYRVASLGGTVATNAGGLRCVKYGVTADWVQTMEVVLASGEVLELGHPVIKDATGYNLKQLFIGSEGTLGVITRIGVTFLPKPKNKFLTLFAFANVAGAASAVIKIMRRLQPSMCELLDAGALKTRDTSALDLLLGPVVTWGADPTLLMVEVDGFAASTELEILQDLLDDVCVAQHLVSDGAMQGVLEVRRGSTPGQSALRVTEALVEQVAGVTMLAQDISVPLNRLAEVIACVRETAAEHGVASRIAAHAGDGNLHVVLNNAAAETLDAAMHKIITFALSIGGAVSGEHGIGSLKLAAARTDLGPTVLAAHAAVKQALDPLNLMNPGKAF